MERKRTRNQHDRIIFNGHDLSPYVMCRVNRPILPTVSPTFESIPGRHGEVFKSVYRDGYDLPVEMTLRAQHRREVSAVRHKLAEMLWSEQPAPLYLPDDPTRYLLAIVSGDTDLGEITDDCPIATVTFHVGDPDYYGQRRRVDVQAGNVYIDAGGNRPSYLKVTAKPASDSSWRITNVDTGEFVQVTGTLSSTSSIVVDMETERATINGNTASVTIDSDFFQISGRTHLNITNGSAKLEWVERWL